MAIPDPATTEWVPLYTKNAVVGPKGDQGPQGIQGPAGLSADLDYVGDYVPATYNDGDIVYADDGIAYICIKNGVTTPPEPWPGTSGVTMVPHATTHNTAGNDAITSISGGIITSGTVADARLSTNVARRDLANTFIGDQYISRATPILNFEDTSQPVDQKKHRLFNTLGNFYIQAVNDAVTVGQASLILNRNGNVTVSGGLIERGRAALIGEWTAYTPVWSTTGTAPTIGNGTLIGKYTIIGKTIFYSIQMIIGTTTNLGTGYWIWTLPPPVYVSYYGLGGNAWIVEGGSGAPYVGQVTAGAFFFGTPNNSITILVSRIDIRGASIISPGNPMAFPSGSSLWIDGRYEMA